MQLSKYISLVKSLKQTLDVPEIMGTILSTFVNEYVVESNELASQESHVKAQLAPHTKMFAHVSECNRIWRTLVHRELMTEEDITNEQTKQMFEKVLPHILGVESYNRWKHYHHTMLVLN